MFSGLSNARDREILPGSHPWVAKCAWNQEVGTATLRLALSGNLSARTVTVKIASGALTAPSKAGTYAVSIPSGAFDTQTTGVTVSSGPVK